MLTCTYLLAQQTNPNFGLASLEEQSRLARISKHG